MRIKRLPYIVSVLASLAITGCDASDDSASAADEADMMNANVDGPDADIASPDADTPTASPDAEPPAPDAEVTVSYPSNQLFTALFDGNLIDADYWSEEPQLLSAGLGFSDIVAVPGTGAPTEALARQAGGAWSTAYNCGEDVRNFTTVSTVGQVSNAFIIQDPLGPLKDGAIGIDGLPVVFSWPLDTRTLDLTDFQLTLNTGEVVRPMAVSPFPNVENNERNVAVLFGEFGNRLPSSDPEARYPVRVEVVEDDSPLLLVGPDARVESAVGLFKENTSSPYDPDNGPRLVGAKLNRVDAEVLGEGVSSRLSDAVFTPNDEHQLYDEADFRIRVLTSGGFSPDGVRGVRPDEFESLFRVHVNGEAPGSTVLMEQVGVDYEVMGGTLRVVGLSELGGPATEAEPFDNCYDEDLDNYIDIILVGDEAAARQVTFVEIPSLAGGYEAFYNPGGPGSTPYEDVNYTSPGPPDLEPVLMAIDDPMRVTREVE
ncbi:MAG: phospholipase [Bradymonadia bacterium]